MVNHHKDTPLGSRCPRCGARILTNYDELLCSKFCGYRDIVPETPRSKRSHSTNLKIAEADLPEADTQTVTSPTQTYSSTRLTTEESQRLYRDSPAGKAAWNRYRYSNLFYEAHARHRQTQKYKDTQARYHEKQKLFKRLLYASEATSGNQNSQSTCPLKLFYKGPKGEVYHDPDKCDYASGDCNLTCI